MAEAVGAITGSAPTTASEYPNAAASTVTKADEAKFTQTLAQKSSAPSGGLNEAQVKETAKNATVRFEPYADSAEFDGSGTLVDKRENADGSNTYYALTAAHAFNIKTGGKTLDDKVQSSTNVGLPDGRVVEGKVFPKTTDDLAIVAFTLGPDEAQIPDENIATVSASAPEPGQQMALAGYPNASVGANDPVFTKNEVVATDVSHPVEKLDDYDAGKLSIDMETSVSADPKLNNIASVQTKAQYPKTEAVIAVEDITSSSGMSGGAYYVSGEDGKPEIGAVHNGKVRAEGADVARATVVDNATVKAAVDTIQDKGLQPPAK